MKEIKMYQCETCKKNFSTSAEALKCEGIGVEAPLAEVHQIVSSVQRRIGPYGYYNQIIRVAAIAKQGHFLQYSLEENYTPDSENPKWGKPNPDFMSIFHSDVLVGNEELLDFANML